MENKTYQYKKITVKIGSNVLTRRDGTLDITRMSAVVDQVAELHPEGFFPPLTVTRSALSLSWTPLAETLVGAIEGAATDTLQTFLPLEFREGGSVGPAPD